MQLIKQVNINIQGRDFIVGDIHGHFAVLQLLLKEVVFDFSKDRLFAVGDLIDRGPFSHEVLVWLNKSWFYSVMGNHEFMVISSVYYNEYRQLHQSDRSGGEWLYLLPLKQQKEIAKAFKKLPYIIELNTGRGVIALLHADVPHLGNPTYWPDIVDSVLGGKGIKEQKQLLDDLLWGRNRIKQQDSSAIKGINKVYVGHTPMPVVSFLGQVAYMDTGAGKADGALSLLDINSNKVYYCATDDELAVYSYILE